MSVNRKSIASRYLKAFLLMIVLPTLCINIVVNRIYVNTLLSNSAEVISQAMEQISTGVEDEIKRISLTASTISNDDGIMDLVTLWNRTNSSSLKFDVSKEIDTKLNYIFYNSNYVDTVIFFYKNGEAYYFKNSPMVSEDVIKSMDWYKKTLADRGKVQVLGSMPSLTSNSWNQYVISSAISPDIPGLRNDVEAIYFGFRTNIFNSFYSPFKLASEGQMYIIDAEGKVMASKNEALLGKGVEELGYTLESLGNGNRSFVKNVNGDNMFVSTHTIPRTGWVIMSVIDYQYLTKDVERVSAYAIVVSLVMLLCFAFFSIFFFRDIILPIKNMMHKMKRVEGGDFNATISLSRRDEIYELGKSYNTMVHEIKRLMQERDLKERERNKAEMEVLQSQINPHFLSNTMNAIRLMAMIAKVESIKNMTEAFIKLLSASIAKTGKFITIAEELDHLQNYIYIMKIRYGDKFDVVYEVDEVLRKRYVLRLILQPIVENAILHGISELEERGEIRIKCYEEADAVVFEIRDNGVGMTQEHLERLLVEDTKNGKGFTSIGVKNVDRRIQLNHGSSFGLYIESAYGEFTQVRMVLPSILSEEGGGQAV